MISTRKKSNKYWKYGEVNDSILCLESDSKKCSLSSIYKRKGLQTNVLVLLVKQK